MLDAELVLREGLPHPDLLPITGNGERGIIVTERRDERSLWIPGDIEGERAEEIEAMVWEKMHFATHLRTERLGEFTVGTDLRRSNSLAIVQVLILYHLVTAKASVALGGDGARATNGPAEASPISSTRAS